MEPSQTEYDNKSNTPVVNRYVSAETRSPGLLAFLEKQHQARKKGKDNDPLTSDPRWKNNNNFMVNMLMLLTQMVDPDLEVNSPLVKIISKALGLKDDPNDTDYRTLRADILKEGREPAARRYNGKLDLAAASTAITMGGKAFVERAPANPTERQGRVTNVVANAAEAANISPDLIVGLWGFESRFGKNLKSPTGALGDFQFTRTTMVETISKNGEEIEKGLRAQGLDADADMVKTMHQQTRDMNGAQIKSFASRNQGNIDTLRNSPEISTYAAAFYSKNIATQLKVDPTQDKNFGLIYAGYNIGVGNAQKIQNGTVATGWEIDVNPAVAKGNTANQQLASYSKAMDGAINSEAGKKFRAQAKADPQPTTSGPGIHYAETPTGKDTKVAFAGDFGASTDPAPLKKQAMIPPTFNPVLSLSS